MAIIKKTYNDLFELNIIMGAYITKNPDNKLTQVIQKFGDKQLKKIFEDYNDEIDNLQLRNCLVDPKTKAVLYSDNKRIINGQEQIVKERIFTVDGEMALKEQLKELRKTEVDVHSRKIEGIDDLIAELTEDEKEAFTEIFI